MNLLVIGPQGSGKGTQAARISDRYTIPMISTGDILRAAVKAGSALGKRVQAIMAAGALVGDDLMIDLVRDRETKEPAPELALGVIDAALRRGLILLKAGVHGNCIRVLCPLTIEDAVLDEALEAWEAALADVLG